MAKTVSVIGIEPCDLRWVRALIRLLRHSDLSIPELARQALAYLTRTADERPMGSPHGAGGEDTREHAVGPR